MTGTYGIVISGSAAFPNAKVSDTPAGGLFNPITAFTIVRGPGNSGFLPLDRGVLYAR
jgi:hypothetical protein